MTRTVLPSTLGAGPKGLGDPDDRSLRKVELEIKIPQIMRDRAREERCRDQSSTFIECCKREGYLMTFKCRQETKELKTCMETWYNDKDFRKECTEQYLEQRRIYRLTGEKAKMKSMKPVLI